jgi:hypothetical protein
MEETIMIIGKASQNIAIMIESVLAKPSKVTGLEAFFATKDNLAISHCECGRYYGFNVRKCGESFKRCGDCGRILSCTI